jgi:hypothetical protein
VNILYPALVLFGLTAFCVLRLAKLRLTALRRGEIDPRFFRQYRGYDEPEALHVASRHVSNLFEAPVLFYAIVLIAFVTQQVGWLPLVLAWVYVLLRVAHSYVHLTTNNVMIRFRLFALSWLMLILLWAVVFLGIAIR